MKELADEQLVEGFKELDEEELIEFVLHMIIQMISWKKHWKNDNKFKRVTDEALGWSENGHCDGGDIGSQVQLTYLLL